MVTTISQSLLPIDLMTIDHTSIPQINHTPTDESMAINEGTLGNDTTFDLDQSTKFPTHDFEHGAIDSAHKASEFRALTHEFQMRIPQQAPVAQLNSSKDHRLESIAISHQLKHNQTLDQNNALVGQDLEADLRTAVMTNFHAAQAVNAPHLKEQIIPKHLRVEFSAVYASNETIDTPEQSELSIDPSELNAHKSTINHHFEMVHQRDPSYTEPGQTANQLVAITMPVFKRSQQTMSNDPSTSNGHNRPSDLTAKSLDFASIDGVPLDTLENEDNIALSLSSLMNSKPSLTKSSSPQGAQTPPLSELNVSEFAETVDGESPTHSINTNKFKTDSLGKSEASPTPQKPLATAHLIQDQIAVSLKTNPVNGKSEISVNLRPENLGKVTIKIDVNHSGLTHVVVATERSETRDLLQQDANRLAELLQDADIDVNEDNIFYDHQSDHHHTNFSDTESSAQNNKQLGSQPSEGSDITDSVLPKLEPRIRINHNGTWAIEA